MTYSQDFRSKVINTREKKNLSMAKVGKRFGVGLASVLRWSKNLDAKTKRNKPATKIDRDDLRNDVEAYADAYQSERAKRVGISESCISYALKRLNITYKKNAEASQSGQRKTLCILRGS